MPNRSKDNSFVAFTTSSVDATIPYTIFVAAIIDPTMLLNLPPVTDLDLTPVNRPPEQQPAIVYLSSLSISSRRPQAVALSTIAAILTGGRCAAFELPWHHLRFAHTNAVRATLAERYAPATANRYLAALRGVM